jgi:hypothetical protein
VGEETEMPRVEILISEGVVSDIISKDENERSQYFRNWALA